MRLWVIVVAVLVMAFVVSEVSAKKSKRDVDSARSNTNKHKRVDGSHSSKHHSSGHKKKGKTSKDTASTKERKRRSTEGVTSESSIKELPWNEHDQGKGREAPTTTKKGKSYEGTEKTMEQIVPEKLDGKSKKTKRIDEEKRITATQTPIRSQQDKEQKKSKPGLGYDAHNSESSTAFEEDSGSTVSSGKTCKKEKYSKKSKNPEGNVNSEGGMVQKQYLKSSGRKSRDDNTKKSKHSLEVENIRDLNVDAVPEEQHRQHSTNTKQQKSKKIKLEVNNDSARVDSKKLIPHQDELEGKSKKSVGAKGKKRSDVLSEETGKSSNENEESIPRVNSNVQKKYKKVKVKSQQESQEDDELLTAESKIHTKKGNKFEKSTHNDEISEKKNRKKNSKYSAKISEAKNIEDEQEGAKKIRVQRLSKEKYKNDESNAENENCSSEEDSLFEDVYSKSCTAR